MALQFSGIILFVKDVEKLKPFYTQFFRFTIAEETGNEWVLLRSGDVELGLHKIGAEWLAAESESFQAETNCKLVFETDEDLEIIHRQLTEQPVKLGEIKSWENYPYRLFDGEDPEGNIFQLKQKKV